MPEAGEREGRFSPTDPPFTVIVSQASVNHFKVTTYEAILLTPRKDYNPPQTEPAIHAFIELLEKVEWRLTLYPLPNEMLMLQ